MLLRTYDFVLFSNDALKNDGNVISLAVFSLKKDRNEINDSMIYCSIEIVVCREEWHNCCLDCIVVIAFCLAGL